MTTSTLTSTPAAPAPQTSTSAKSVKPVSAPKAAPTVAAKAVKVAPKPAAKKVPAAKKTVVAKTVNAAAPVVAKDVKVKKPKLVRDSFTIPKDEYVVIEALKQRAATLAHPVKKSELLRAGLKLLATLPDSGLRTALQAVPSIKTGRPKAEAVEAPKAPNTKTPAKSARK